MHTLAKLYATGKGGAPRDLARAYYWSLLALRYYGEHDPNAIMLRTHLKRALEERVPFRVKNEEAKRSLTFVPKPQFSVLDGAERRAEDLLNLSHEALIHGEDDPWPFSSEAAAAALAAGIRR